MFWYNNRTDTFKGKMYRVAQNGTIFVRLNYDKF